MLDLNISAKFKRDRKLCIKRHWDMSLLVSVVNTLRIPAPLSEKYADHDLTGNWVNHRECHIAPDWILIYRIDGDSLYLDRTGTHSDLLRM